MVLGGVFLPSGTADGAIGDSIMTRVYTPKMNSLLSLPSHELLAKSFGLVRKRKWSYCLPKTWAVDFKELLLDNVVQTRSRTCVMNRSTRNVLA